MARRLLKGNAMPPAVSALPGSNRLHLPAEALTTAQKLVPLIAETAVERDRAGGTPERERDLLRESGLLTLSIPERYGGLGASFSEALSIVRLFATVDGSLAHVFGFQQLMLATVRLFGSEEQYTRAYVETVKNAYFWGNALNPPGSAHDPSSGRS